MYDINQMAQALATDYSRLFVVKDATCRTAIELLNGKKGSDLPRQFSNISGYSQWRTTSWLEVMGRKKSECNIA